MAFPPRTFAPRLTCSSAAFFRLGAALNHAPVESPYLPVEAIEPLVLFSGWAIMTKHVLEIGTDGAAICAYDPAELPDDFDLKDLGDRADTIHALAENGRMWYHETGGDGSFVVHVYVNETPILEPYVEQRVIEQSDFMRFACPSGTLVVCGAEYVIKDLENDDPGAIEPTEVAERDSQILNLPPGDYRFKFRRVDMDGERETRKIKPIWQNHASKAAIIVMLLLGFAAVIFLGSGVWSSITYLYRWATDFLPCPCQRTPMEILAQLAKAAACGSGAWLGFLANKAILNTPAAIAHWALVREAELAMPDYIVELQGV